MFDIDYKTKVDKITSWMKKTVNDAGFENVVVAVSGGVDSAVSLALAVRAFGKEHVYVILLPYGILNEEGTQDARLVLKDLEIPEEHILLEDIQEATDAMTKDIPESMDNAHGNLRRGNVMARVRMIYLYDYAKKLNALVVGTENKSEYHLGYFTRFGDQASDIEPIMDLYKTQVWELAKYLKIPQKIIEKPPSAGLWKSQTDEQDFGFSYKDADVILYHHFEEGLPEEGIVALGIERSLIRKVLRHAKNNDFKHHLPFVMESSAK